MVGSSLINRSLESPNWRDRKDNERLEFIIIHGTWMAGDEGALARLVDPVAEVSCHYYITRSGEIIQLVGEEYVAYHAGKSTWQTDDGTVIDGLNGWSLGIELANSGPFGNSTPTADQERNPDWTIAEPYTEAQYISLIGLLRDIFLRHSSLSPERVLGHADVSPGRKSDPGPHFDWKRLVDAGVAGSRN